MASARSGRFTALPSVGAVARSAVLTQERLSALASSSQPHLVEGAAATRLVGLGTAASGPPPPLGARLFAEARGAVNAVREMTVGSFAASPVASVRIRGHESLSFGGLADLEPKLKELRLRPTLAGLAIGIGGAKQYLNAADGAGFGEDVMEYDNAFRRIARRNGDYHEVLLNEYKETDNRSRAWYRVSLIAAVVGLVFIGGGVAAVLFAAVPIGVGTMIFSAVPGSVGALFYAESRVLNRRKNDIHKHIQEGNRIYDLVQFIDSVEDQSLKDELKKHEIIHVLGTRIR